MSRPEIVSGQTIRLTAAFTCRSCGRDVTGAKARIVDTRTDSDSSEYDEWLYWIIAKCPSCKARHEFYSDANTVE